MYNNAENGDKNDNNGSLAMFYLDGAASTSRSEMVCVRTDGGSDLKSNTTSFNHPKLTQHGEAPNAN